MQKSLIILFIGFIILLSSCGPLLNLANKEVKLDPSESKPVSHIKWSELLQKHVRDGKLDYQGVIKDSILLNEYLKVLSSALPNDDNWSRDEQFAYWVNAYNAFTVKLIVDNYPVNSIKDIKKGVPFVNTVWDIKFITIENQQFDLNNIEHGILRRKFKDPRIHFAVNCASISCPALLDQAFTAKNLNQQLDSATKAFLYDKSKNNIDPNKPSLSQIFTWYKPDFTDDQTIIEFVNKFIENPISNSVKVSKTEYDWNLNDIRE